MSRWSTLLAVLVLTYLVEAGRLDMAIVTAEKAARVAQAAGNPRLADEIRQWIGA